MSTPPAPVTPTPATGLDAEAVAARVRDGLTNAVEDRTSRPISEIVRANVLTRFNAILAALGVLVLTTGAWKDALFLGVVVINSAIGIMQELHAKRTLDGLAVLNAPTATVIRSATATEVPVADVVRDDLLALRAGDQVCADGVVTVSTGLEIDESLLTGESDPIDKQPGDPVLSGSIVVAGSGRAQVTAVGADSHAQRLAAEARQFTRARSELQDGTNTLLRYLTWALVIVGPILLWGQLRTDVSFATAMTGTVAGLVGMVPEGLVLLTSLSFMLAAVALARRKVLVQELPAVEGLARVDVVCLDKTGTLTYGDITFAALHPAEGADPDETRAAVAALVRGGDQNATAQALAQALPESPGWQRDGEVPFSSARKWSAASFGDRGRWVIGAPEMVLPDAGPSPTMDAAAAMADEGRRVLLVAHTTAPLDGDQLPAGLAPAALVELRERVRDDAAATLAYFATQRVELRVMSGDNPRTVGAVAREVELPGAAVPLDARTLPDDLSAAADVLEEHTVLGRVTPEGKRHLVRALQSRGHVVAMTGDGVNDALALKDSDIGVAMGSGAPATRAVAQLVLMDGRFAHMPRVVAEGRRVIANIERVASLFVIKNIYSGLLGVMTAAFGLSYPFLPRHLTAVSALTIGVPAFILALAPNNRRYTPGFMRRVLARSLPAGAIGAVAILAAFTLCERSGAPLDEARTASTVAVTVLGLAVISELSRPWAWWKAAMVATLAAAAGLGLAWEPLTRFFALTPTATALQAGLAAGAIGAALVVAVWRVAEWRGILPHPHDGVRDDG